MPLILAVEPNTRQAQQLASLVRQHLSAELVTAASAEAALAALGDRVPDLILTPALLGLRDEAALTARLRELGAAASHVQTLAVPILAAASARPASGGLLGRKRDRADTAETVGCEPALFAEQIQVYLERAALERVAPATLAASLPPREPVPAQAEPAAYDEPVPVADEPAAFDIAPVMLPILEPPPAPRTATPETRAMEMELGLGMPATAAPSLWRISEGIEDFYTSGGTFGPAADPPAAPPDERAAGEQSVAGGPTAEGLATIEVLNEQEQARPSLADASDDGFIDLELDDVLAAVSEAEMEPPDVTVLEAPEATILEVPEVTTLEAHPITVPAFPDAVMDEAADAAADTAVAAARTDAPVAEVPTLANPAAVTVPPMPRPKRAAPPLDDWAYFDPSQSPFKALVRRLDEIAGQTGMAQ